ncbi:ornithine cyclodeaminase family protein [Yimella sp. cx-51]|uniref:ornithine cyclodeaminase family protein n=1 Tax=Yimella sp. cx-51 TaxID=2770551 RepID=UPI00165DAEB8|nr:ornithine cyclodeaminase family protein [Yimella sp. cx-51]MBC9955619.1 ornithine cyclodeaminase family protein [Yimella sp. cx-51]QTH37805.1 ornithine cyclodeaminase family protein [Yimella sp. cx-51]
MRDAPPTLVLNASDIEEIFTPDIAIASQQEAFEGLGRGTAVQPERIVMTDDHSDTFCYAAKVSPTSGGVCKFGAVVPGNTAHGLPSISATVLVLDPEYGTLAAILDGTTVTTMRTAAASAVAVRALARNDSSVLAVIGAGVQGVAHAHLIGEVLDLSEIRIFSPDEAQCRSAVDAVAAKTAARVSVATSAAEAVRDADVIVTCTTSSTPVLQSTEVADGATVVSVGSFAADRNELDTSLMKRAAAVVVDHLEVAKVHAGSVRAAVADGALELRDVQQLGDVLVGSAIARQDDSQVIVYNTVGIGMQDAAAAEAILSTAREMGRGTPLPQ